MALLDIFAGPKPKRAPRSALEEELLSRSEGLLNDPQRSALIGLQDLALRDLELGRQGETARALGATSADVAQQFAVPTVSREQAIQNALRRGKALSRLSQYAVDSASNQLLKDRIAAVQAGRSRQARGFSALAQAAGNATALDTAQQGLDTARSAARQNMFGSLAGIGLGFLPDILRNRRLSRAAVATGVDVPDVPAFDTSGFA